MSNIRTLAAVLVNVVLIVVAAPPSHAGTPTAAYTNTDSDCLFNWAERTYPTLFAPADAPSETLAPYYYRYYSQTRAYLGTSSADDHVYYLGPLSSNSILDAGALSGWLTTARCPAVKQPILGLIDMQNISWHNTDSGQPTFTIANVQKFAGIFGGIVINAAWNLIQPSASGPLDFSTVDNALDLVRAYNAANPTAPLGVKLRVYAGTSTPDWAKQINGGPVTIYRNPAGCQSASCPITVGKYWTPDFITAWRNFQALLAARYDAEPLIRQVAITSCAPQTDEPFVPSTDAQARTNLKAAGYTDAAEQSCLMGAIDDYADWKNTLIDYTFNVFTLINGGTDSAFTLSVMENCRAKLGSRCVLDNHALSVPLRTADAPVYQKIQATGAPINFQTESPQGMGCLWISTIAQGVALGAAAIEVWPDAVFQGFDSLTVAEVAQLASEFTHPIPVPDTAPLPTPCSGFH